MSKKRRRKRITRHVKGRRIFVLKRNVHHLLFQNRHWTTPSAKQLRSVMTRELPVSIHNELHNKIVHDIPKPDDKLLRIAFQDYLKNSTEIDSLDICQLILWLCEEIPDEAFRACMMLQYRFLRKSLSGLN